MSLIVIPLIAESHQAITLDAGFYQLAQTRNTEARGQNVISNTATHTRSDTDHQINAMLFRQL
jgi:hypothetical protein